MKKPWFSKIAVWLVIGLVLITVFKQFDTCGIVGANMLGYSDFLEKVRNKHIKSAIIQEVQGCTEILAITTDDRKIHTTITYLDRALVGDLISNGFKFDVKPRVEVSLPMTLLVSWGPILLILLFLFWIFALIDILRSDFKDGSAKISWLIAVMFLPILGLVLYLLFGREQKLMKKSDLVVGWRGRHAQEFL